MSKSKKQVATASEIANDPSLKYVPYRRYEAIWSDELSDMIRFLEYVDAEQIAYATMGGMAPVVGRKLQALKCRRSRPESKRSLSVASRLTTLA